MIKTLFFVFFLINDFIHIHSILNEFVVVKVKNCTIKCKILSQLGT